MWHPPTPWNLETQGLRRPQWPPATRWAPTTTMSSGNSQAPATCGLPHSKWVPTNPMGSGGSISSGDTKLGSSSAMASRDPDGPPRPCGLRQPHGLRRLDAFPPLYGLRRFHVLAPPPRSGPATWRAPMVSRAQEKEGLRRPHFGRILGQLRSAPTAQNKPRGAEQINARNFRRPCTDKRCLQARSVGVAELNASYEAVSVDAASAETIAIDEAQAWAHTRIRTLTLFPRKMGSGKAGSV